VRLGTANTSASTHFSNYPTRTGGADMAKTQEISIRCQYCRQWFPSPIFFGDSQSFDTATLFNNKAQCHHCHKMTGCDKENFRARFEDGGFIGNYTPIK
jgi:hypothetical protein